MSPHPPRLAPHRPGRSVPRRRVPTARIRQAALPRPDRPGTRAAEPGVPVSRAARRDRRRPSSSSSAATSPSRRSTPKTWRLTVEGARREAARTDARRPAQAAVGDADRSRSSAPATAACFSTPPVPGLQWGQGAVGNAEWTGVPLAAILEKAGVKNTAVEVILDGADSGQINADLDRPGPIHFDRSLPLEKAKKDEVLLALQDERRGAARRPRLSAARRRRRLVRDGVGEVADADRRDRPAVQGLLADARLLVLRAQGRVADAAPGDRDAAEGDPRPAGSARSDPGRQAVSTVRCRVGRESRRSTRSKSAWTAARPGPRRNCSARPSRCSGCSGNTSGRSPQRGNGVTRRPGDGRRGADPAGERATPTAEPT